MDRFDHLCCTCVRVFEGYEQAATNIISFAPTNQTQTGVGSTLGLGLYVLAGQVASSKAGPGVMISFALAALASAFSALCYAEFAGRVPRAGSAYAYSYISVGEFVAFIIGWNMILEYVIGASSVARGFSGYLTYVCEHVIENLSSSKQATTSPNSLVNFNATLVPASSPSSFNHQLSHLPNTTTTTTIMTTPITNSSVGQLVVASSSASLFNSISNYVQEYFDWPTVVIIIVLTIFILIGVKESTNVTIAFTGLNLLVVSVVVISSLNYLNLHNWRLTKSEVPPGYGEGGFLPYGWSGVLAGSATCFFGFIGFDTIASSAEEAKNPKRTVPLAILISLFISFLAYMAIAVVQTLIWPYYEQDKITILPYIFGQLGMPLTYWTVLLGAISGLASSLLGGMFPLPRILYSMAHDKLIYGSLAKINGRLKLPVRATIVGSVFVALLACLLDIQDLADMVSIGTLAAYSLVSLSVLILRYENRTDAVDDSTIISNRLSFTDILNNVSDQRPALGAAPMITSDNHHHHHQTTNGKQQQTTTDAHLIINKIQPNENFRTVDRCPLTAKQSTPIREKGSKPLVPQLSAGFQSWFKAHEENNEDSNTTCNQIDKTVVKQPTMIDLLTTWRIDELNRDRSPNDESSRQSKILISMVVLISLFINAAVLLLTCSGYEASQSTVVCSAFKRLHFVDSMLFLSTTACILLVGLVAVLLVLSRLPTSKSMSDDMFQVPMVPLVPTLSILVNIFLMLNLSYLTWVRFTVWMAIGLFIYFTYGIWHSEGYLLYLDR